MIKKKKDFISVCFFPPFFWFWVYIFCLQRNRIVPKVGWFYDLFLIHFGLIWFFYSLMVYLLNPLLWLINHCSALQSCWFRLHIRTTEKPNSKQFTAKTLWLTTPFTARTGNDWPFKVWAALLFRVRILIKTA